MWARNPPVYIPAQCPSCVEVGTLIGHGVRKRSVWLTKSVFVIFIYARRLKCSRRIGGEIQPVLQSRFVEKHSYGAMERSAPSPSASTQREWIRSFTLSACLWLRILVAKFAELNPGMVYPGSLSRELKPVFWPSPSYAQIGSGCSRLAPSRERWR